MEALVLGTFTFIIIIVVALLLAPYVLGKDDKDDKGDKNE